MAALLLRVLVALMCVAAAAATCQSKAEGPCGFISTIDAVIEVPCCPNTFLECFKKGGENRGVCLFVQRGAGGAAMKTMMPPPQAKAARQQG
jgi:hypothetical protein